MYREPHLNTKSKECADIWYEWYDLKYEKREIEKAAILRKKWCKCCEDFGEMISQEVKTNPRYMGMQVDVKHPEPPR
jgi:hypothetical protein